MTDVMLAAACRLMFGPAATVWTNVQAGKLKALAVTPDDHACSDRARCFIHKRRSGVPGYSAGIWMGLLAPAGTPPEIVDKLAGSQQGAMKSEKEVQSLLPFFEPRASIRWRDARAEVSHRPLQGRRNGTPWLRRPG